MLAHTEGVAGDVMVLHLCAAWAILAPERLLPRVASQLRIGAMRHNLAALWRNLMTLNVATKRKQVGRPSQWGPQLGAVALSTLSGAAYSGDLCKEMADLLNNGLSISIPAAALDQAGASPTVQQLASSWRCESRSEGTDSLVACHSAWAQDLKPVLNVAIELGKEMKACVGPEWRQRSVRLNEHRATSFLHREGEKIEYELSLQTREAPSSIDIAAAVGVPRRASLEGRVEFLSIGMPSLQMTGASSDTESDALCAQIREVVQDAASGFHVLRGAKSGDSWQASKNLPSTTECGIDNLSDYVSYGCKVGTFDSRGALRSRQIQVSRHIATCLGSSWETSSRPRGNGIWVYSAANKELGIDVEVRGTTRKEKLTLMIDIDKEK